MPRRSAGESSIVRRQQSEAHADAFKTVISDNFKLKNLAKWEEQTEQTIQRNQVRVIADKLQHKQQQILNRRRSNLRSLLDADNKVYETELDALRVTPEETRELLRARAIEIRNDNESKKQRFIEEQYRKQFRASCDDLRHTEGQNVMWECDKDRREQLKMKALYTDLAKREDDRWAKLWEADRQKKIQREQHELAEQKHQHQKTFEEIDKQVTALQQRRRELEKQKAKDTTDRIEQLKRDAAEEIEHQKREAEICAQRRAEVTKFNQEFQERRAAEQKRATDEELAMLNNMLEKEAEDTHDEQAKKKMLANDMREYLTYRDRQRHDDTQLETELERLRDIELQKASDKQDLVWNKEKLAREKLMREVYENRQMQVLEKDASKKREKELNELERKNLLQELNNDKDNVVDERQKDRRNKNAMANTLKNQMEDNKYRREVDKAERLYEQRASDKAEQRYQEMVEREKKFDKQNIGRNSKRHNLKSMNWFN